MMRKQGAMKLPVNKQLIDIFDLAITEQEADFLLRLGTGHMTRPQAAARTGLESERFDALFDGLLRKGMLSSHQAPDGDEEFFVSAFLVGWFERQLCRGKDTAYEREFARRMERLFESYRKLNFFPLRNLQNMLLKRVLKKPFQSVLLATPTPGSKKRISVNRAIEAPPSEVAPTRTVLNLVERCGDAPMAAIHCFCRYWRKSVGDPCRFRMPDEGCIIVGNEARHCIKYGIGREVTADEALSIIATAQKAGAIHTMFHERDEVGRPAIGICNCCWDCCGIWGGYNRGVGPLNLKCFYEARVSAPGACKGCGMCEKHCPTAAIVARPGKSDPRHTAIDRTRCIGCGQCAYQCNHGTITLDHRERDVFLPLQPPGLARISPP